MALDFIFRFLLGPKAMQPAAATGRSVENRHLERYPWREPELARLELTSGEHGELLDISYGSIGASLKAARGGFQLQEGRVTARLTILDRTVDCVLKPVRSNYVEDGAHTAFLILHETTESLIFLRDLIEPLRCAQSLAPIARGALNERYRGAEWECWRGDGPTDLVMRCEGEKKELREALLTYRADGAYHEIGFKDGTVQTRDAIDRRGVSQRMAAGSEADPRALRYALCFFAGLEPALATRARPMIEACRRELGTAKTTKKGTAA